MDVESQTPPALGESSTTLGELIENLRSSARGGDLGYVFQGCYAGDASERFAALLDSAQGRLTIGDSDAAWYALARAAEFAGFCRAIAGARVVAMEEQRLKAASRGPAAAKVRMETKAKRITLVVDALLQEPHTSTVWKKRLALNDRLSELIQEHFGYGEDVDTGAKAKEILQDPRLAPRVGHLLPRARRAPNKLPKVDDSWQ